MQFMPLVKAASVLRNTARVSFSFFLFLSYASDEFGPDSVWDKMDENVQTGLDCKLRGGNENFVLFSLLSLRLHSVIFQTTLILFAYIFA